MLVKKNKTNTKLIISYSDRYGEYNELVDVCETTD